MSRRDSDASSIASSRIVPSDSYGHTSITSSIYSLSATTASRHSSHISKSYRQASTLFLTRRLPEALTTVLPLISPPEPVENGEPAPVARASRNTRVKIWSLYLTILNAILEMDPEEGKDAFGNKEWRGLCNRVRDGDVWEEVVKNGYHGNEGDVDPDVVINLATLQLAHARDQLLNQKRLETYLASSATPNLDFGNRFNQHKSPRPRSSHERFRSPAKSASGAETPRDLNARVKILELYTLHVLVRNNEWEYAREFINVSAVLDDERREAFLQALQSLQDEQEEEQRREEEERQKQEEQLRKDIEIAKRLRAENEERERRRQEEEEKARLKGSEVDYGIEPDSPGSGRVFQGRGSSHGGYSNGGRPPRPALSRPNGKAVGPPTLTARASMVFSRVRAVVEQLGSSLNNNPVLLMRLMAFIVGLIIMVGHKGLRQRVQRILGSSWGKIKSTAGMGTKVSYI